VSRGRGAERLAPSDVPVASPHKADGSGRMRGDAEPEGAAMMAGEVKIGTNHASRIQLQTTTSPPWCH
jgi:hypothetical protein